MGGDALDGFLHGNKPQLREHDERLNENGSVTKQYKYNGKINEL